MVIATNSNTAAVKPAATMAHPYDPLSIAEIENASQAVRNHMAKGGFAGHPATPLFNSISLLEPPKYDVLRWQGLFSEKELASARTSPAAPIKRQADVSGDNVKLIERLC